MCLTSATLQVRSAKILNLLIFRTPRPAAVIMKLPVLGERTCTTLQSHESDIPIQLICHTVYL